MGHSLPYQTHTFALVREVTGQVRCVAFSHVLTGYFNQVMTGPMGTALIYSIYIFVISLAEE